MRYRGLFLVILTLSIGFVSAQKLEQVRDLSGYWKFEIGDNPKWSAADFDDSDWEEIYVPATWEDEGFPGYDGWGWYRRSFTLVPEEKSNNYYLLLGVIDDVDEAYLNGHFIGFSGTTPPDYFTAANQQRRYRVPAEYLNFKGRNFIAVRVYDDYDVGGIKGGAVGLYEAVGAFQPDMDLSGLWHFKPGDTMDYKEPGFKDSDWKQVIVPAVWETQGYKDLGGFGWYRKKFVIRKDLKGERLILLVGKIDDLDETYLNGHLIGRTGRMRDEADAIRIQGDEWQKLRAYYIPPDYVNFNGSNTIAVRVFDGPLHGGIHSGPIGIVSRERYLNWKNRPRSGSAENIFEWLFGKDRP